MLMQVKLRSSFSSKSLEGLHVNQLAKTFKNRRVLITGHTGFKGSWLALWLKHLGAEVIGLSLPHPPTVPNCFDVIGLDKHLIDIRGDIRDYQNVHDTIETHQPEIVFHLAAQPIVLTSYKAPKETFDSNAAGTVNVLEALRRCRCAKAIISITTDKVYENQKWPWGYRENDILGGRDPYSASKAMAEIAIASYRQSFFSETTHGNDPTRLSSTRAGNVIGGGDFAYFRLIPDCMAALMREESIIVRNPISVRPWQHVLEPLSGYIWLAVKMLAANGDEFAGAWNFGPLERHGVPTQSIVEKVIEIWGSGDWSHQQDPAAKIETAQFTINWDKAAKYLNWMPVYGWEQALEQTVLWYKHYQKTISGSDLPAISMSDISMQQIHNYTETAQSMGLEWAQ